MLEIHRILIEDGWFCVVVQGGESEGWESGPYDASVARFFARYGEDEFAEILARNGFRIASKGTNESGTRRWMQFLCQRGGIC